MARDDLLDTMPTLKRLFWPILKKEYGKFVPMLLIYSLIVFNYSLLKTIKDALVVTAKNSGAATIPFIKLWAILPMALLSTLIFTRLANKYSKEKVFTIMMTGFLTFFFIFAFFLYPNQNTLHPNDLADRLQSYLPKGFTGLIAIFRNWTFTLFYVMSELWGTMIMSVLFWGFANEVTSVKEAGRFYSILSVGANLSTIVAGQAGVFFCSTFLHSYLNVAIDRWSFSLMVSVCIVIVTGILTLLMYRRLNHTLVDPENTDTIAAKKKPKAKKMGLRENFAYLARSKYLICIALLVLSFNGALTLIEIVWKDQAHQLYPYGADYSAYMANVMSFIGILSTILSIFVCGQVVRKFGWTVSAYVTPVILLISASLFFFFYLGKSTPFALSIAGAFGSSPLAIITLLGSVQNVFSRASKFTFFDVTKEMAFIPLSKECKQKGKSAIDGVGSRLGKSGASLIHQSLLLFFGTVTISAPYVGCIIILIFLGWLVAVRALGKLYSTASKGSINIPQKIHKKD
ncbi:NTP/NDP exchange transporter [bacterium]|nr:NTP/NDP exchange transporter [bacterium]